MNENTEETKNTETEVSGTKSEETQDTADLTANVSDENKKPKESYKFKDFLNDVCEVLETVAVFLLVFFLLKAFVFDQAIVDGDSMVPTLLNEQKLVYSKIFKPENGDIVIAYNDRLNLIVKRVIATEGQELDIRNGEVYVDGVKLNEQVYAGQGDVLKADYFVNSETEIRAYNTEMQYPVTIPEGCVFLMGDNRHISEDSRGAIVGFVDEKDLVGEVVLRYSPLDKFRLF